MDNFKKLIGQSSSYFLGNMFGLLVGLISFPLWTRVLSTEEYGVFSLISISVFFLSALTKNGLQRSAIRYFYEFTNLKRKEGIASYYSTHIIATFLSSLLLNSIFLVFVFTTQKQPEGVQQFNLLVVLTVLLALIESFLSILLAFLRAAQKALEYATINIISGFVSLGLSALLFFKLEMGLAGIILGQLITGGFVVLFLLLSLVFEKKINLKAFSINYLKEAIKFGIPLVPVEQSKLVLELGDRYLIQFFMGSASVGLYSVAYNLTSYVSRLLAFPFNRAVTPIYLDMYEKDGIKPTQKFLEMLLNYYFMVAIPLIFVISYFGEEIIRILASSKFVQAASIIPYVATPLILYGANTILGAGLIIFKKTKIMMNIAIFASMLNVALNLLFIPILGLQGAAIATLIAYLALIFLTAFYSYKFLPLKLNYSLTLKYLLASIFMLIIFNFLTWNSIVGLAIKLLFGLLIYSLGVIIVTPTLWQKIKNNLSIF